VIVQRAVDALKSTEVHTLSDQTDTIYTCSLATAALPPRPDTIRLPVEQWDMVRWQYAQALYLLYCRHQFQDAAIEEIIDLQLRMSCDDSLLLRHKMFLNWDVVGNLNCQASKWIYSAALRWLSYVIIKDDLFGERVMSTNDVMSTKETRFEVWQTLLDDTGKLCLYSLKICVLTGF
jgi:hypothetical protein